MNTAFPYVAPFQRTTQGHFNRTLFDQAIATFRQQGNYLKAFYLTLDALNPDLRTQYGNPAGTEFHIPHGSIIVDMLIEGDMLRINADFLELPEKGRVAMLRQLAELNICRLFIPRFRLDGDRLKIEASFPLVSCDPYKLYEVLRDICNVGDKYDDEMCLKFGARRIYEPQITFYSQEDTARICETIRAICREAFDAAQIYSARQQYNCLFYALIIPLFRIDYFVRPKGELEKIISQAVRDIFEEQHYRIAPFPKGQEALARIMAMTDEQMAQSLYTVVMLMPGGKEAASVHDTQQYLRGGYDAATKLIDHGEFEECMLLLTSLYYKLYYDKNVTAEVDALLAGALRNAVGKPMADAAKILYQAVNNLLEGNLSPAMTGIGGVAGAGMVGQIMSAMQGAFASLANAQQAKPQGFASMEDIPAPMREALQRGDAAEYMRLLKEYQKQQKQ